MKRKIWIHKAKSFKDADAFERGYYSAMSVPERLNCMQYLREICFKMKGIKFKKGERRIQKVARIIRNGKIIAELT